MLDIPNGGNYNGFHIRNVHSLEKDVKLIENRMMAVELEIRELETCDGGTLVFERHGPSYIQLPKEVLLSRRREEREMLSIQHETKRRLLNSMTSGANWDLVGMIGHEI